jgi:hypothetical protein
MGDDQLYSQDIGNTFQIKGWGLNGMTLKCVLHVR